jgi:hypothetical protein
MGARDQMGSWPFLYACWKSARLLKGGLRGAHLPFRQSLYWHHSDLGEGAGTGRGAWMECVGAVSSSLL